MSAQRCTAILRSVHSAERGCPCGRAAKHETTEGPRCGYHEPAALLRRIAQLTPYAAEARIADAAE